MSNVINKYDRVVVLVDMDCFYCQVEEKLNPSLKGKPIAVVQYNAWKGGGIIAVNYPARDQGVTRHMRGDEARQHCPSIELVPVPNVREKADLSKYRNAGKEVAAVLQKFTPLLERASVDEAYLDITGNVLNRLKEMNKGDFTLQPDKLTNTYAVGYDNISEFVLSISNGLKDIIPAPNPEDRPNYINAAYAEQQLNKRNEMNLLIGAVICNEIRMAVKEETGYDCSAGIAHNKILSKLVCGINKPNKQTLLPLRHVNRLYRTLPIKKITGLGGKFGDTVCETLNIKMMEELASFSQEDLQQHFDEKNGLWLYLIGQGIDLEPVSPRFASKSIGCCKKFPGRNAIKGLATLEHWFKELATEIFDRIEKDEFENNRRPRQMVVSYTLELNREDVASSRSVSLPNQLSIEKLANDALDVLKKNVPDLCQSDKPLQNPVKFLGISVSKFEDLDQKQHNTIESMFSNQKKAIADTSEEPPKLSSEPTLPEERATTTSIADVSIPTDTFNIDISDDSNDNSMPMSMMSPSKPSFFSNRKPLLNRADITSNENQPSGSFKSSDENAFATNMFLVTEPEDPDSTDAIETQITSAQITPPRPDYRKTYAEFQCPVSTLTLEVPPSAMEKCAQCNKKVLISEMQSHSDAHFAFQLSQQQRAEFRSQIKPKVTPPPAAKKQKLDRTLPGGSNKLTITPAGGNCSLLNKFLVKTGNNSNENGSNCMECGKTVEMGKITEHADYHAAKRLQMDLNRAPKSAASKPVQRTSKQKKSNTITPSSRSIPSVASFFKQASTD